MARHGINPDGNLVPLGERLFELLSLHQDWLDSEGRAGQRLELDLADLSNAPLGEVDLSAAKIQRCNLRNANLSGTNLMMADLSYCNLTGADLSGANLSGCSLRRVNLTGATLLDSILLSVQVAASDRAWPTNLQYARLNDTDLRCRTRRRRHPPLRRHDRSQGQHGPDEGQRHQRRQDADDEDCRLHIPLMPACRIGQAVTGLTVPDPSLSEGLQPMAILFLSPSDDPAEWLPELQRQIPDREVRVYPDIGNPDDIDYALIWRPPAGVLKQLPNLKVMLSLGAGVDGVLNDPELPDLPLVRMVEPGLTEGMTEFVVLQVLHWHRQMEAYRAQQRDSVWRQLPQKLARERRVGILGLGVLGADAARVLTELRFDVAGWSRSARELPGITCFHGAAGLSAFLARTEILVCLLPADGGDGRHPQLGNPGRSAEGGLRRQRRARRARERGGHAGRPRQRTHHGRQPRRVQPGAAAARSPVLEP